MEYTEAKIQKVLFTTFAGRALTVPNCHFQNCRWEMDVLVVTLPGLAYEYEIKLTQTDFKNELKHKERKHKFMCNNRARPGTVWPNYFSFVCPPDIIAVEDIWDERYGLFYVDGYYLKPIRKPKKLHDVRVEKGYHWALAKKLMFKYFNHADKFQVREGVR